MRTRRLVHLDDNALISRLRQLVSQERAAVATLLVHLGEVEARGLHLPAGYSSMFEYCVREFGWTRQTTFKRIGAARAARKFPVILAAIADGRLNVSGVILLRSHLTSANAEGLLTAAAHRTKSEIELLLAERFPKRDIPTMIAAATPTCSANPPLFGGEQRSPGIVAVESVASPGLSIGVAQASKSVERPPMPPKLTPLAPERFALQVTIAGDTHALLRRAQELLSHQCISGDVAQVLHRALQGLVRDLEKRKYAATDQPRAPREGEPKGRHIPAHVRRAVRARDGDQCTFIGENGKRCASRIRLEFDHVRPFALGGTATVDGLRLRCRAHNQFEAERVFGAEFMGAKCSARARAG